MNETATHDLGKEKKATEEKTDRKPVLAEGTGGTDPVVRFKVDGVVKSLNKPVTGADLYRVAGTPKSLKLGGKEIKNDSEPVEIEQDAEVKSSH